MHKNDCMYLPPPPPPPRDGCNALPTFKWSLTGLRVFHLDPFAMPRLKSSLPYYLLIPGGGE